MKRVLILARADSRGSLYFLGKHLRAAGIADVRVVVLGDVGDAAWQDLADLRDGGQELRDLLQRADVLHLVDLVPGEIDLFDHSVTRRIEKPNPPQVVVQIDGLAGQAPARQHRAVALEHGWPIITTEAAQHEGALFLPPYTPTWNALWSPRLEGAQARERGAPATVFCGSSVPFRYVQGFEKLVDRIEEHTLGNPRLRTEFLVTRSYRRLLQRQRTSQLSVVHFRAGETSSVLHSLVQGVPVVVDLPEPVRAAWGALAAGESPPVLPMESLAMMIRGLTADAEPSRTCSLWARTVLDPARWLRVGEALYAGASTAEAAHGLKSQSQAA